MQDLAGKVAVITGGASGIGLATARRLGREDMKVVIADIEQAPLDAAVRDLQAGGADALGVRTDVGKLEDVQQLAERTLERFGKVHLVFNNAGVNRGGPIQEMTHADWQWILQVNLWGVIHGVEVFVPRLLEQGEGGHIVNTASFAGLVPNQGLGAYCVSKYGVVGLSEVLYRDLSAYGVGVSVLCPMVVNTNIRFAGRNRQPEFGGPVEEPTRSDEEQEAIVGRHIEPDDVAELVLKGVLANRLYIHTHAEARGFIQRRFNRIDRAFADAGLV
ncbi:MAG TPA: SDR family NAD(P)-dependent oxidoreductase [Dehalococcoidia bacterium]|nr:SDR family NAD(P)-dependent oxidoreductase [Dehalococcoidia bacterium]